MIKKISTINHYILIFSLYCGRWYPVCSVVSVSFSNDNKKGLFTLWQLGSVSSLNIDFQAVLIILIDTYSSYLFIQITILLIWKDLNYLELTNLLLERNVFLSAFLPIPVNCSFRSQFCLLEKIPNILSWQIYYWTVRFYISFSRFGISSCIKKFHNFQKKKKKKKIEYN